MASTMPLRRIGKDGPTVPALGLGLLGMSTLYGKPLSDEERFKVLDRAAEIGATFWDSSDMYADSEELLGKWFKRTGKRDQIFLITKFGFLKGSLSEIDSSADFCKKACAASLKALGTDHIDLYFMHRANPKTPIEETMRAMLELKAQGKVKYIGLCEVSSSALRRALKIGPVDAVQAEYSPFEREIEGVEGTDLLKTCKELGIPLIAYAPLGRGMLTGNYNTKESISAEGDFRSIFPRFSDENLVINAKVVSQFKAVADKKGCTGPQLALAWLLKQGQNILPIPGCRSIKHLEENWAAAKITLTDAEDAEIRKIVAGVAGSRTPDWAKYQCYVDTEEEK